MAYISGIVIFFSILILMIGIITLSGKRIMFTRDYIVYAKFDDVIGLQDQAKVYMRGYRIGWVKDVKFVDDGVIVRIDINKKYKIPRDSRFEINTVSLIGEKAITIHPGIEKNYLQAGELVQGKNKDIVNQMRKVIEKLDKNLDQGEVADRIKDLSESIVTLKQVLRKFDSKISQINVASINKSMQELQKAGQNLNQFLKKNEPEMTLGIKKFNETLDRINKLSAELTDIAQKVNQGKGSAGLVVNNKRYIQKLDSTLNEINSLVKDFKENPKKYINLSVF